MKLCMKNLIFPLCFLLLSACAASTSTEKRFLVGEPDAKDEAKKVQEGLHRNDYLEKEKFFKSERKTVKVSTGVFISFTPITHPLVVVRKRENINQNLNNENTEEKLCFESRADYIDEEPIPGIKPSQIDFNHWKATLTHENKTYELPIGKNPTCKITKRTPQTKLTFGVVKPKFMDEYSCLSLSCVEAKIDLLKPFVIDLKIDYDPTLQPMKFQWIGIKESKIR